MLDPKTLPLAINLGIFAAAAAIVWWTSIRLTRYGKIISDKLGDRPAFVGLLLLGGVASLPETATTVSAAWIGNAPLAVSTLLGGIAITLVIIAVVDGIVGHEPLSSDVAHPILLLQAALTILLLTLAAAGIVAGDRFIGPLGIGGWTTLLFLV